MTKEQLELFQTILRKNKEEVDRAAKEFEKSSQEFNRKIKQMFSVL